MDDGVFACLADVRFGGFQVGNGDKEVVEPHEFERALNIFGNVRKKELTLVAPGALLQTNQQADAGAVDEFDVFQIEHDRRGRKKRGFHFFADALHFFEIQARGNLEDLEW